MVLLERNVCALSIFLFATFSTEQLRAFRRDGVSKDSKLVLPALHVLKVKCAVSAIKGTA